MVLPLKKILNVTRGGLIICLFLVGGGLSWDYGKPYWTKDRRIPVKNITISEQKNQLFDQIEGVTRRIDRRTLHQTNETPGFPGQQIRFEKMSIEQGLSQSSVYSIYQDSRGFLWFGTEDGLNKFDGYNFTVYRHNPDDPLSLSDNTILSIFEDKSGELWVGTYGRGLNRFDRLQST